MIVDEPGLGGLTLLVVVRSRVRARCWMAEVWAEGAVVVVAQTIERARELMSSMRFTAVLVEDRLVDGSGHAHLLDNCLDTGTIAIALTDRYDADSVRSATLGGAVLLDIRTLRASHVVAAIQGSALRQSGVREIRPSVDAEAKSLNDMMDDMLNAGRSA